MIYQKLAEIQNDLFVPKGQHNDYGNYSYRSCEDVLKAVKPICKEKGCVLFITNEMEVIGDRNYVKAIVRLVEIETGEQLESTAHAREEENKKGMDGSQITGAASSYARKYALAGMFCIDNEKDSDATNDHGKGARQDKTDDQKNEALKKSVDKDKLPTKDGKVSKEQWDKLNAEMERTGIDAKVVTSMFNVKDIKDMTEAQVITALNKFAKTKDKAK